MSFAITFDKTLSNNPTTVPKPSGLAVGDLMIAHVFSVDTAVSATWHTGWTLINKTSDATGAPGRWQELRYKFADSGDVSGSNVTIIDSWSNSSSSCAYLIRVAGASELGVVASAGAASTAQPSNVYSDTITPGTDNENSLLMFFVGCNTMPTGAVSAYAITTSDPGGWTEAYDQSVAMAYVVRPQITATGNSSATTSSGGNNIGQIISVRPARTITVPETQATSESYSLIRAMLLNISETQATIETYTLSVVKKIKNAAKNVADWLNKPKN